MFKLSEKSYLEFSDESKNSHKFYEVAIEENKVTFRFGRIGDNGQTKIETYETHEKAKEEAGKKIQEKLKKGYKLSVSGETEKKLIHRRPKPTFEEQLQNLAACGIKLCPQFSPEVLWEEWEREDFEKEPYELLLIALGGDKEIGTWQWTPLSNDIWNFDTECIEDHGAYVEIAERMRDLANGDLPLQKITDYVDVDEEVAWLEFELNGKKYHWDLKIEDDWVDTEIFGKFIRLLEKRNSNKKYIYFDTGGQDCLIGCCTSEQLKKLREVTNLDFIWLT